jgi:hypothetical protein
MRGKCIHYRGSLDGIRCAAGVDYEKVFGPREGIAARAPCIQEYKTHERVDGKYVPVWKPWARNGFTEMPCDKREMPTPEQIAEHDAKIARSMDRMRVVMTAISGWRKKKPRGKTAVIDCPTKCGGKLHLSQAASNGHVWGQCTTAGCVSWME